MSIYEEIEIEDLDYDPEQLLYTYPCPCGDKFRITLEELWDGEDIATCPSCTLRIEIVYEEEDLPPLPDDFDASDEEDSEDEEEDVKHDVNVKKEEAEKKVDPADALEKSLSKVLNI